MSSGDKLGAILFDMDGTLVDTEKVWQAALVDLAAHHGGVLSAGARAALIGAGAQESMEILFTDIGKPEEDYAAGDAWLAARMMTLVRAGVRWRPGARDLLLEARAAGVPTALVTATGRTITEAILDTIGHGNFDVTITADDVTEGKPDPEPYRLAAGKLGVEPACCVAIEDSPGGIDSAVAAGCVVLGVPSEVDLAEVAGVTLAASLTGVDLAHLRALVTGDAVRSGGQDGPRTHRAYCVSRSARPGRAR